MQNLAFAPHDQDRTETFVRLTFVPDSAETWDENQTGAGIIEVTPDSLTVVKMTGPVTFTNEDIQEARNFLNPDY